MCINSLSIKLAVQRIEESVGTPQKWFDRLWECLKENTPIGRGVCRLLMIYSLYGGHKPGGAKFIPVYQIYTPQGISLWKYKVIQNAF
jgi:hypothetical protein